MKVEIKKTVSIKNADNWKDYAPPKDAKTQWKDGRSAKELARFVTSEEFIPFLRAFLKDLGIKNQDFEAEPEAETYFPEKEFGKSGPRNHDLLMIGEDCVIGFEAKVSEGFGNKTIAEEWKKTDSKNKKEKRIPGLVNFLSQRTYDRFEDVPDSTKSLMYQLFTATAGTVIEAKKKGKKTALVLILVFTGNVDKEPNYDAHIKKNNSDFDAFVQEFFPGGDADIQGIHCLIRKVEVTIKSPYCLD